MPSASLPILRDAHRGGNYRTTYDTTERDRRMPVKFYSLTRCHTCNRESTASTDELDDQGWLSPYFIRSGDAIHQTALCPECVPDSGIEAVKRWSLQHKMRLGPITQRMSPGYSFCKRCATTWEFVRSHSTQYNDGSGCFPLCEMCWGELTPEERLPFYRRLYEKWLESGPLPEETWFEIQEAVLMGL